MNPCQPFLEEGLIVGTLLTILAVFLFNAKHLVVDFFLQNRFPYMWQNKHLLLHPGGWLHAGSHGLGSMLVLGFLSSFSPGWIFPALIVCLWETFAHFFIDFTKMNIGRYFDWRPESSPHFWDLLGIDQFLHQVTYLIMLLIWINL